MEDRDAYEGTSTELHKKLEAVAEDIGVSVSQGQGVAEVGALALEADTGGGASPGGLRHRGRTVGGETRHGHSLAKDPHG
jgi:hypothetical protein